MTDNSAQADVLTSAAQGQLRSIVDRIERLEAEKAEIAEQIKEVYAEAKGNGYDVKILRKVVVIRRQDRAKRQEEEAMTDLYLSALGELPLFESARSTPSPAEPGPKVTVTFATREGATVTAPLEVVGQALDAMAAADRADDGALYAHAVTVVRESGNASTSHVQRRLQIGYNKAASFIERMQREGVIGPPDIAGKREVLQREAA